MTTPSDHPPPIPPIGVRAVMVRVSDGLVIPLSGYVVPGPAWATHVPLALDPAQPARLSGEPMP